MKILHISDYGTGGAGIAAYRLHVALRQQGIDSQMLLRREAPQDPFISTIGGIQVRARGWLGAKITKLLGIKDGSLNLFPTRLHKRINASDADIVHLHWINNEMISIKEIAKIDKPIIWTLHDCWAFMGTEHHSDADYWKLPTETTNHKSQNHHLKSTLATLINRWIFKQKQKQWKDLNIHFIAPSQWMAEQLQQSKLFSTAPVTVIPNLLDPQRFRPKDQTTSRKKLHLPLNKKLLLFGAYNPLDPNKGSDLLEQALRNLPPEIRSTTELIIFGAEGTRRIAELKTHWIGTISNEETMVEVYNAADLICVPSRRESFGQTASESLACGTPVVAFRTTGLIDIVDHKQNGYLAQPFSPKDFTKGILWILQQNRESNISVNAQEKAKRCFAPLPVTQQYLQLLKK